MKNMFRRAAAAAIEMLAFSNVLNQYGAYLQENSPVVIVGRLSLRDDKEPQLIVNRARPISDFTHDAEERPRPVPNRKPIGGTLYLRLPSEQDVRYPKVKAILNMFPGDSSVVLYFADSGMRRGTRCVLMESMILELRNVLDEGNVIIK